MVRADGGRGESIRATAIDGVGAGAGAGLHNAVSAPPGTRDNGLHCTKGDRTMGDAAAAAAAGRAGMAGRIGKEEAARRGGVTGGAAVGGSSVPVLCGSCRMDVHAMARMDQQRKTVSTTER